MDEPTARIAWRRPPARPVPPESAGPAAPPRHPPAADRSDHAGTRRPHAPHRDGGAGDHAGLDVPARNAAPGDAATTVVAQRPGRGIEHAHDRQRPYDQRPATPNPLSGAAATALIDPPAAHAEQPSSEQAEAGSPEPRPKTRMVFVDIARSIGAFLVVYSHLTEHWSRQHGHTDNGAHSPLIDLLNMLLRDPLQLERQGIGQVAVPVFFLISGFVVTPIALRQGQRKFAINRALRIFPALMFVVLLTAGVLLLGLDPLSSGNLRTVTVVSVLTNLVLANYLMVPQIVLVGVAWTLIVEVLFYLVLIILLPLFRRNLAVAMGVQFAFVLGVLLTRRSFGDSYFLFAVAVSYIPIILLGQTIWAAYHRKIPLWLAGIYGVAGWALYVAADLMQLGRLDPNYNLALAYAVLFFLLGLFAEDRLKQYRPWTEISERTYSIYLMHGLVAFPMLTWLVPYVPFEVAAVVGLIATAGAVEVCYRLVEQPSHQLARRLTRRKPAAVPEPAADERDAWKGEGATDHPDDLAEEWADREGWAGERSEWPPEAGDLGEDGWSAADWDAANWDEDAEAGAPHVDDRTAIAAAGAGSALDRSHTGWFDPPSPAGLRQAAAPGTGRDHPGQPPAPRTAMFSPPQGLSGVSASDPTPPAAPPSGPHAALPKSGPAPGDSGRPGQAHLSSPGPPPGSPPSGSPPSAAPPPGVAGTPPRTPGFDGSPGSLGGPGPDVPPADQRPSPPRPANPPRPSGPAPSRPGAGLGAERPGSPADCSAPIAPRRRAGSAAAAVSPLPLRRTERQAAAAYGHPDGAPDARAESAVGGRCPESPRGSDTPSGGSPSRPAGAPGAHGRDPRADERVRPPESDEPELVRPWVAAASDGGISAHPASGPSRSTAPAPIPGPAQNAAAAPNRAADGPSATRMVRAPRPAQPPRAAPPTHRPGPGPNDRPRPESPRAEPTGPEPVRPESGRHSTSARHGGAPQPTADRSGGWTPPGRAEERALDGRAAEHAGSVARGDRPIQPISGAHAGRSAAPVRPGPPPNRPAGHGPRHREGPGSTRAPAADPEPNPTRWIEPGQLP